MRPTAHLAARAGITIVFAASMGHVDGSVQVCGLQIANDLVNSERHQLSDKQLMRVAKGSMAGYMVLGGVVAYLTFSMTRLQLLAQVSYQGIVQLAGRCSWAFFWRGGNARGAVSGMVSGFGGAMVLTFITPTTSPAGQPHRRHRRHRGQPGGLPRGVGGDRQVGRGEGQGGCDVRGGQEPGAGGAHPLPITSRSGRRCPGQFDG